MDRTRSSAMRTLLGLVAVGGAALGPAGCAELQQFAPGRSSRPAGFGEGGSPGVDPYLGHHQAPAPKPEPGAVDPGRAVASVSDHEAGPERTVVRSTAHPVSRPVPVAADPGPAAGVSLGRPIAIAPAGPTLPDPPRGAGAGAPADSMEMARGLIARSKVTLASMGTYQVQIHRQERVGDSLQPAEDILLSIRREPRAVRLEWPAGPHKGREVIYSTSDPSGMLHVHMGDSVIPVPKLSLPPDSPMVAKASRHPITEAGFETILANLERSFSVAGDGARVAYEGTETPEAVGRPCHKFTRATTDGENWLVYLDEATTLPALVRETAASGDLLELDIFHDVRPNVAELSSAEAFDPGKRWGVGLFGRIARSPGIDATSAEAAPRR